MQDILFLAIFLAALLWGPKMLNLDGDLPRHLLTGRFILETKTIPTTEPFAYPYEGRPYVSHEWLTDLTYYLIYKTLGLAGLVVLAATLLAAAFTSLYAYVSSRLDVRIPALVLFIWGALVTSLNWAVRPHLVSMLLLVVWLVWMDRIARGEKIPLWAFFVTMTIWSNLHGEFIAGMLVTVAYTVGWTMEFLFNRANTDLQTGRRLWAAFLASALASLLNPAGYQPYVTLFGFVNNPYLMSRMAESNPPDFSRPEFLSLLGLLAVSIVLLAIHPKRLSAGQAFLLAGFSGMSLLAARNIHLYGIVAPFVLAETVVGATSLRVVRTLEGTLKKVEGQIKSRLWPVVIVILSGALILGGNARSLYSFSPTFFPVDAVAWLEDHPQEGRMFNDLNWGGYIALHLWPEQKVFADSMADVTGEMTLEYETALTMSEGWEGVFAKREIEWAILPPGSELAQFLSRNAAWEILYSDSTAVILRMK